MESPVAKYMYSSPIGELLIVADKQSITHIRYIDETEVKPVQTHSSSVIKKCINQLNRYFDGTLKVFDLPLNPEGTDFQKQVWNQLIQIPYGKMISYMQLSMQIGNPKAIRAVGTANGSNPIPIIIPCHRVIGSNGTLTGYSGGIWRKKWLIEHEAMHESGVQLLFKE